VDIERVTGSTAKMRVRAKSPGTGLGSASGEAPTKAFKLTCSDGQADEYDGNTKRELEAGVLKLGREAGEWTVCSRRITGPLSSWTVATARTRTMTTRTTTIRKTGNRND
jgi:hypothetical protein